MERRDLLFGLYLNAQKAAARILQLTENMHKL
jgi:hypothetical protein